MELRRLLSLSLVLVMALAAVGVSGPIFAQEGEEEGPEVDMWGFLILQGTIEVVGEDILFFPASMVVEEETEEEGVVVEVETGYPEDFPPEITIAPAGSFNPSMLDGEVEVIIGGFFLNDGTFKPTSLTVVDEESEEGEDPEEGEEPEEPIEDPEEDPEDEDGCGSNEHPVLMQAAEAFGADYDYLVELHCDGNGIGNIIKALQIADTAELTFDDVWESYDKKGNWREVRDEYEISPSALAPGQAKKNQGDEGEGEELGTTQSSSAPGNSGNAPGQNKVKKDKKDKKNK